MVKRSFAIITLSLSVGDGKRVRGFALNWIWWHKTDGDPFKQCEHSIRPTREQKRTKRQTLELQLNGGIKCAFLCQQSVHPLELSWGHKLFGLHFILVLRECQCSPRDAIEDFETEVRLNILFQISAFDLAVLLSGCTSEGLTEGLT